MCDKLKDLNMRVPAELHRRIKVRAAQDGKDIRDIMMEGYELYDKQPPSKSRKKL